MSMKTRVYPLFAVLLGLAVAGCQTTPIGPARDTTGASSESINEAMGVQELRREVAELRDTVEVQRNELEKLRERQRQLYDDLDYRIRQGEQGAAVEDRSTAARQQQSYGQTQDENAARQAASGQQTQEDVSRSEDQEVYGQQGIADQDLAGDQQDSRDTEPAAQEEQTAAIQQTPDSSQQPSTQMAVAGAEEQAAYDSAFELLKQSRYNDAIIEFRAMISEFPNGALVDDAQYWIGEAYYVTRDFENALDAFQTVVNRYSDSQRVPEALLKLGYVQAELGRNEDARRTLNQVISQYPGSRVAISAETRLSRIR